MTHSFVAEVCMAFLLWLVCCAALQEQLEEESEKRKQSDRFRNSLLQRVEQMGQEVQDMHRRLREMTTKYETVKSSRDKALAQHEGLQEELTRIKQQQQQLLRRAEEAEQQQQLLQQQLQQKTKQLETARQAQERTSEQLQAANADLSKRRQSMLSANDKYKELQEALSEALAESSKKQQELSSYKVSPASDGTSSTNARSHARSV